LSRRWSALTAFLYLDRNKLRLTMSLQSNDGPLYVGSQAASGTETTIVLITESTTIILNLVTFALVGNSSSSVAVTLNAAQPDQLAFEFESFRNGSTLVYDPLFSVLLSGNEAGDGSPNLLPLISLVAVPIILVLFTLGVVGLVLGVRYWRRYRPTGTVNFTSSDSL